MPSLDDRNLLCKADQGGKNGEILAEDGIFGHGKCMSGQVTESVSHWRYLPTLIRIALAVGCGLFVGHERKHHGKAGVRTFGLAALLGCLGGLSEDRFAILAMIFLVVLVCF
jgi:hypothetical protein